MYRIANSITAVALSGATMLFAIPVFAQVPGASTSGQAASVGTEVIPGPNLAEVESALAAIEADTGIEDAVKNQLRSKYTQAIDALKESADFLTKAADYRGAIEAAPNEAAIVRDQLKALPSADSAAEVSATGDIEDIQKDIDLRRAALNGLSTDLVSITSELARVANRPVEIVVRLAEAERELSDIRKYLASPEFSEDVTSPGRVAELGMRRVVAAGSCVFKVCIRGRGVSPANAAQVEPGMVSDAARLR